ncbi:hypothetical protein ZWY2020_059081 [Hordeum vulgare]|nr:hypothetical protein ZWY2020_059081 [Hordeum vulgare]
MRQRTQAGTSAGRRRHKREVLVRCLATTSARAAMGGSRRCTGSRGRCDNRSERGMRQLRARGRGAQRRLGCSPKGRGASWPEWERQWPDLGSEVRKGE